MKLVVARTVLRLRHPFEAAWGTLSERELIEVTVTDGDGLSGRGEAAPLEPYDGVPVAAVYGALDAYSAVLAAAPPGAHADELIERCRAERPLPQALAAIDTALWDLEGRRAGAPVRALLHPRAAVAVPVNATIGALDRAGAAAAAAAAVARGLKAVKVKVGTGDDAGRVAAVRAAGGRGLLIRVDANGAWASTEEAVTNLRVLAPAGIELAEEPVSGVAALRELRAVSPVPIAMDETAAEQDAAAAGATDAVCLKISRCGGISGLLREAGAARAAGSAVYVSSTFDGPVGIAAALHAAAAIAADGPLPPCGLATLGAFVDVDDPFVLRDGALIVPDGPGLL